MHESLWQRVKFPLCTHVIGFPNWMLKPSRLHHRLQLIPSHLVHAHICALPYEHWSLGRMEHRWIQTEWMERENRGLCQNKNLSITPELLHICVCMCVCVWHFNTPSQFITKKHPAYKIPCWNLSSWQKPKTMLALWTTYFILYVVVVVVYSCSSSALLFSRTKFCVLSATLTSSHGQRVSPITKHSEAANLTELWLMLSSLAARLWRTTHGSHYRVLSPQCWLTRHPQTLVSPAAANIITGMTWWWHL